MPRHTEISCANKGCYAIITLHPDDEKRLRRTHETFYCPAGHSNYFPGKTPAEKEREELERRAEREERLRREWMERWDRQRDTMTALVRGVQVCPLGCGWTTRRRVPWNAEAEDVGRFLDRVGADVADHLLADHNATRKPVALIPEQAQTHVG